MPCPRSTVLIGDDTDLLILLCYQNNLQSPFNVYLKTKPKNDSNKLRIWNIKCTQEKLGTEICRSILILHTLHTYITYIYAYVTIEQIWPHGHRAASFASNPAKNPAVIRR